MKIQCHWIFKDPLQESQNHFNIGLKNHRGPQPPMPIVFFGPLEQTDIYDFWRGICRGKV